jgi:hypothetical protein
MFQPLEMLQRRIENVWPLISNDDNISAINQWKIQLHAKIKEKLGPFRKNFGKNSLTSK